LLLGKEVLPVLVLALKLIVGAFYGGLLLLQLADLLLKHFRLIALLQSASDGTLSVLQSLASLFVILWVRSVVIVATSVDDCLLQILLLLLRDELSVLKTRRLLILLSMLFGVMVLNCCRSFDYGCIVFLGYLILLHLFLRHLLVFAAAALVGDLLEGVVEDDSLRGRVRVV